MVTLKLHTSSSAGIEGTRLHQDQKAHESPARNYPIRMPRYQLLALDAQVFTFLIQANSGLYDPATDSDLALATERVAVFRVFLYYPGLILALPTVTRETGSIADPEWRRDHELFGRVQLLTGMPLPTQKVDALAVYYESLHPSHINDCRIVAEAELARVDFLLTYDFDLLKRLAAHTGHLQLEKPSSFWTFLNLPRGTPPNWIPHSSHPLAQANWWRW